MAVAQESENPKWHPKIEIPKMVITPNGLVWQVEPIELLTCGPIPGALILTVAQIDVPKWPPW